MTARLARTSTLVALLAASAASWAGVDVEIRSGDKVTGTISPGAEIEFVRFRLPKGAVVTVKGAAAKKGPQIHLQLKDPAGSPVSSAEGKSAAISKQTALVSGLYSVEVTSRDGASTGDYTLAVSWKTPASFGGPLTIPAAGTLDVAFAADAGATATFTVKPAKKSAAAPTLARWTKPDASVETLSGTSQKRTIGSTGDCTLTVASVAGGDVIASVKIKAPAAGKHKYALTSAAIGSGDSAVSGIVGPDGGTISTPIVAPGQPGSELNGAGVTVPIRALAAETAIVIATATAIATKGTQTGAGPTVSFGPDGLKFDAIDKTKKATVTIPFDASFTAVKDQITILTRDAKGVVKPVAKPYSFNVAAHTVSFATSHFSSFRATAPAPVQPTDNFTSIATIADPRDVCTGFDTTSTSVALFVAEGNAMTVAAIHRGTFQRETWVGGGTQTTTPANRTQFQFPGPVVSVFQDVSGYLYAATATQIWRVDPTGVVSLYAGTGATGDTGDGGPAIQATFTGIRRVLAPQNGGVFVADLGAHRVRFIGQLGGITAFAGDGSTGVGADGGSLATTSFVGPTAISIANHVGIYVADGGRIRWLSQTGPLGPINVTVAGSATGATGSGGDGGAPLAATFQSIAAITQYTSPVTGDDDVVTVADDVDHTLRQVNLTTGTVTLFAGAHGSPGFNGESGATPGLLSAPDGLAANVGLVFVCDKGNQRVRQIRVP